MSHLRERCERDEVLVRAALRAAWERLDRVLRRADDRAWLARARCDAPDRPSRFNARVVARERVFEGRLREGRLRRDRRLRPSFSAEAVPLGAGGNFTPALRAFERPIAIACLGLRTPCFPSLTWWISSRTNSPAWVLGAFPSRASSRARSIVSFSGIVVSLEEFLPIGVQDAEFEDPISKNR
jgi:hypothetical protein